MQSGQKSCSLLIPGLAPSNLPHAILIFSPSQLLADQQGFCEPRKGESYQMEGARVPGRSHGSHQIHLNRLYTSEK